MHQRFFKIFICFYFINTTVCLSCQLSFDGLTYLASDIENGHFFIDLSKRFTQKDIFKIKAEIASCRANTLKNNREKQDTLFQLNNDKSKLIGSQNIKGLISRIQTLKIELNDLQKPLQAEINKISFMGLYAALIESEINTSQEALITNAKQRIAESAIEKVKTEISSHTIVQNNQIIMDKINSKSSGEMQIYDKLDDRRTFLLGKTQMFYVAVVNVYPLKTQIKTDYRGSIISDGYVVNLISEDVPDWFIYKMTELMGGDITREKVNLLSDIIKNWKKIVVATNKESIQTQKDKLSDMKTIMQAKNNEITNAESTLYQARRTLKSIYKSLSIKCYQRPENCLDDALSQTDRKIQAIVNEYILECQKEKVQDGKMVIVSNKPSTDMKPVVKNLYRTMKEEYCKTEQVLKASILDKGTLIKDYKQTDFYITKEPETVQVYPYTKNGNFHVLLVMGFKINQGGNNPYSKTITNSIGMKFVRIKPGQFMMGSPVNEEGKFDNEPYHSVRLTREFYMQTTEVTQEQWKAVMGNNPSFNSFDTQCPVENVSWEDTREFIRRLNQMEKTKKYRLPTEAEWEYAARAGTTTAFYNGGIHELKCGYDINLDKMGWYCGNSYYATHPVALKQPNAWGLYDMHGNLWEWCQDWYTNNLNDGIDPVGSSEGQKRVIRGGAFIGIARHCRSASRNCYDPGVRDGVIGFRLARTLNP